MSKRTNATSPDTSRWNIIYPVYINSKKTLAEGRRIPVSKGVENPTLQEIVDSCNFLKIPCIAEVSQQPAHPNKFNGVKRAPGTMYPLICLLPVYTPCFSPRRRTQGTSSYVDVSESY